MQPRTYVGPVGPVNVGVDTDGLIAMDFGVFGLPETFLINEDGKIIYKFMGPLTEKIIKDEIEPLL